MYFLDAFYYMIITSSTIGYGDIFPETVLARFIVIALVLCFFAVFGDSISKIATLVRETNFNNKFYKMKNHIVIIGTL